MTKPMIEELSSFDKDMLKILRMTKKLEKDYKEAMQVLADYKESWREGEYSAWYDRLKRIVKG